MSAERSWHETFFEARIWSEIIPKMFGPLFCGSKKSRKIPAKFPAKSAVKQRGREEKGPPDIAPKSFSQKGPKCCSVPSIGVIGKSVPVSERKFLDDFWGPFLSRPLCLLLTKLPSPKSKKEFTDELLWELRENTWIVT